MFKNKKDFSSNLLGFLSTYFVVVSIFIFYNNSTGTNIIEHYYSNSNYFYGNEILFDEEVFLLSSDFYSKSKVFLSDGSSYKISIEPTNPNLECTLVLNDLDHTTESLDINLNKDSYFVFLVNKNVSFHFEMKQSDINSNENNTVLKIYKLENGGL